MGVKREEIRGFDALNLKRLNDNIKFLWWKAFKNVDFGELGDDIKSVLNSKIGTVYMGSEANITNGSRTIQLPAEFINKSFKVIANITKVTPTGTANIKSFSCKVSNTDTISGRFTVTVDGQSSDNTGITVDIAYTAIS